MKNNKRFHTTPPVESYQNILASAETGKVCFFHSRKIHIYVAVDITFLHLHHTVCSFDMGAGLNLQTVNNLDHGWLSRTRELELTKMRSTSNNRIHLPTNITLQLHIGEFCTWFTSSVVEMPTAPVLVETNLFLPIDKLNSTGRNESSPEPPSLESILMVHEVNRESEKNT